MYLLYELWRGVTAGAEIQTEIQSRARNHGGGPRTKQPKYRSAKYKLAISSEWEVLPFQRRGSESVVAFYK